MCRIHGTLKSGFCGRTLYAIEGRSGMSCIFMASGEVPIESIVSGGTQRTVVSTEERRLWVGVTVGAWEDKRRKEQYELDSVVQKKKVTISGRATSAAISQAGLNGKPGRKRR